MSVNCCLLDKFPVEILHIIFDHLSSCDILRAFLKVSSYIDSVIWNYNFYQINFRSILKCEFDLICHYIKPRQMISLILSDGINTPDQSQLFLSLIKFEEFYSTLRSLSLIDINDQSMTLILNHLEKFNNLSSLTIISSSLISPPTLISGISRLNISCEWFLHNITMMFQLKHLILYNRCTFYQLKSIIIHAPKLISLNICLERENGANIHGITSNLTRLVLNMSLCQMNIIQMKQLLNCFNRLLHFEVECRSDLDLCDGHEWEVFLGDNVPRLKTFNFKFQLKSTIILNSISIQNILRSYSSAFWLKEKQWFIGIEWDQRLVYSIPRFSYESADPNFRPPYHCTAPDDSVFYDHINALAVWGEASRRFKNVRELWLVDNPLKMDLEKMIDANRVERLIFVSPKNDFTIDILIELISQMNNLNFIQFSDIPLFFNDYNGKTVFRQIRSIEIMRELKSYLFIERLNNLFPQIERLHMKIKSKEDIQRILHCFSKHLSIVTFDCDTSNFILNKKFLEKIFGHSNFTFQMDSNAIRFWIGFEQSYDQFQFGKTKNTGCFSWCSGRKFLFKR